MAQTLSLLFAILAQANPGETDDYFPLRTGMNWAYETDDGKEVVKSVEKAKIGETECWALTHFGLFGVFREKTTCVTASVEGIVIHKISKYETSFVWLKYPLKRGEKWSGEGKFGDVRATLESEVVAEEEIEVPAGKYACLKVRTLMKDDEGTAIELTTWYAKGVGEVKSEVTYSENGRDKRTQSRQLKKFETPEEK